MAAHARDLALLEDAEQIGLRPQADVADLIEKDGPPLGDLEFSLLPVLRSGEGAFLVAEKLALEQRLGQRAAVDGHERVIAAGRGEVNRPRDELLAGAALSGDQDGGVGGRDGLDGLEDLPHGGALADHDRLGSDRLVEGLLEHHVLAPGLGVRERVLDDVRDVVGIERLGDVVVGAVLERRDGRLDRGIAGHDDDAHLGLQLVHPPLELDSVGPSHLDVDEGEVPFPFREARERVVRAFGGPDFIAFFLKPSAERVAYGELVVDDQNPSLGHVGTSLRPAQSRLGGFLGGERDHEARSAADL